MQQVIHLQTLRDNAEITLQALVTEIVRKNAVNGLYLDIYLQDQTGVIIGKLWQVSEEQLAEVLPLHGSIVDIQGVKSTYRDQIQIKIQSIRLAPSQAIESFVKQAPLSMDELKKAIESYTVRIKEPVWQALVTSFLQQYEDRFYSFPAAVRNHHEYVGGLAHHTLLMLQLAERVMSVYPQLNQDLLYAGICLHDLGKVIELSNATLPEYTVAGQLLGHITIMVNEIGIRAKELAFQDSASSEKVILLQHVILSHHGQYEFGSPKMPMIREAEVLHFIDNLDARMMMIDRALAETTPGSFSTRVFPLTNRRFFKPSNDKEGSET